MRSIAAKEVVFPIQAGLCHLMARWRNHNLKGKAWPVVRVGGYTGKAIGQAIETATRCTSRVVTRKDQNDQVVKLVGTSGTKSKSKALCVWHT